MFDRYSSFWISLLFVLLLFLPKVNLLSFDEKETAGIRIDDALLLFFFLIYSWATFANKNRYTKLLWGKVERALLLVISFSVVSFFVNRIFAQLGMLEVDAKIFYSVRLAEYFLFFYVGILLASAQRYHLSPIIKLFFLWNALLMLFQKGGWIGQFSIAGYLPVNIDRVTGIASFPSEAGLLLNMIFAWWIYEPDPPQPIRWLPADLAQFFHQTRLYWIFLLCIFFIAITGSRIALLALSLLFLCRLALIGKRSLSDWIYLCIFLLAGTLFSLLMIVNTEAIFERSVNLLNFKNLELLSQVWDQVDIRQDLIFQHAFQQDSYDPSWWIRLHKWIFALKIFSKHPECYLLGIGPGFCGAALDGGFLRLVTENGIIGFLLFCHFFLQLYRQNQQLKWIVIAFLINMIFFDAYLAYKPMSLLFLMSGWVYFKQRQETPQIIEGVVLDDDTASRTLSLNRDFSP